MDRRDFIKLSATGLMSGSLLLSGSSRSEATQKLIAAPGEHRFVAGQKQPTRVLHYNQSIPGPTLRLPQGETTEIEFINRLA